MATSVTMPQLGETVVEGTILRWLKKEGEHVDRDEPLFEISTDKVDTEVPSPAAGTLAKIMVQEGETVSVGTELARIDGGDGAAAAAEEPAQEPAAGATPPAAEPEAAAPSAEAVGAAAEGPAAPPAEAPRPTVEAPAGRGERSHILSPLVRRLAEEHRIDLSQVEGSGTGGRITKQDVEAYLASRGAAPAAAAPGGREAAPAAAPEEPSRLQAVPAPAAAGAGEEIVPVSHIRKAIAQHMTSSLQTTARAWNMVEVDMERVARVRAEKKAAFAEREGLNLTYMPFVARATVDALLAHPMVNSELRGEEVVVRHFVNLGIAVSYDEGLIVPVVKGADTMNLVGIARAINDLATRARAKQLKPDEVHGGTFTITNPGPFGSVLSVPIITQPQTGILAFDSVVKRALVIDDAIAIRHTVYLSMSWDHRVIDGALASQFLSRLKENLETWDWAEDLGL